MDAMIIRTKGFATSLGDPEVDELICVYCVDESGYCLSLARFPEDKLIEVMVLDQVNHKTRDVSVELSADQLRVSLSPAAALDGIREYLVPLALSTDKLRDLDAALTVIFAGGRGRYDKIAVNHPVPNPDAPSESN